MAVMPGFSVLVTLVMGVGVWSVRSLSNRVMAGGLVAGIVLAGAGLVSDLDWLAALGVFVAALFIGTGIGRLLPSQPGPILLFLLVLSVADIVWIGTGGGSASGSLDKIVNFSVEIGSSSSSLGTVDLVLAAIVATHWLRRDAGFWLAVAAAPIGMIVSDLYVAAANVDNLPLVPFITLGWLMTEAWHRRTKWALSADS